ncbi:hypothetical protein FQA39_LY07689 [Lamprigera yunnana]|nr:hypothetical protein FQA39_LY07689 [Lamprigera yunnana]
MKVLMVPLLLLSVGTARAGKDVPNDKSENIDNKQLLNWLLIYPGTKWCGTKNIAENPDDLGTEVETDKCCRSHDMCNDNILSGESKHNLTNRAFYTRLSCECDNIFLNCLQNANTETSNSVGNIYFNILGTQCFQEEYPIIKCASYTLAPAWKCTNYTLDTTKEKIYQWFDVPVYKTPTTRCFVC